METDDIISIFERMIEREPNIQNDNIITIKEYMRLLGIGRHKINFIEQRPSIKTLWEQVKEFFNRDIGDLFTRQELLMYLRENGHRRNISSVDTYRNYLHKAGYLETLRRGVYKLVKEIPVDLSVQDVRSEAYNEFHIPIARDYRIKTHKFIDVIKPKFGNKNSNQMAPIMKKKEFLSEDDFKI